MKLLCIDPDCYHPYKDHLYQIHVHLLHFSHHQISRCNHKHHVHCLLKYSNAFDRQSERSLLPFFFVVDLFPDLLAGSKEISLVLQPLHHLLENRLLSGPTGKLLLDF